MADRSALLTAPRAEPAPPRVWPRTAHPAWTRLDTGLLLGVAVLALALRLPNYQTIPAMTDETAEIYRGWLITRGEQAPLTAGTTYKGSLWTWLVAAALWATGSSLYAPRSLILALGVATVGATYLLGRTWGGRPGGVVAAALLATATSHVAVNSHVAWGSCAVPLFTTLGTWALCEAVRGSVVPSRRALVLAGLFWGLALQTHPLVLALLPAAAVFLLWRGRWWLRTRALVLAAGLFVLATLNLLAFNLTTSFRSVSESLEHSAHYTGDETLTALVYLRRLGLLLFGLVQNLAGAVDLHRGLGDALLDPAIWVSAALAAAGVLWQWRRGNPLPALLLVGVALVLPLFNDKFTDALNGRYLAPLLPVLYASIGALFAGGIAHLGDLRASGRWTPPRVQMGRALLALAAGWLVLHPLLYLRAYYDRELSTGRTSAPFFRTLEQLHAMRDADQPVVVLRPRREFHMGHGNGLASEAFRLALSLEGISHRVLDQGSPDLLRPDGRCRDQLLVLTSRDANIKREVVARLDLRGAERRSVARPDADEYGLYRLDRLPGAPAC